VSRKGPVEVRGKKKVGYRTVSNAYIHGILNEEACNGSNFKYLMMHFLITLLYNVARHSQSSLLPARTNLHQSLPHPQALCQVLLSSSPNFHASNLVLLIHSNRRSTRHTTLFVYPSEKSKAFRIS